MITNIVSPLYFEAADRFRCFDVYPNFIIVELDIAPFFNN